MDGIITNHPERLVNVLRENEFVDNFRLATQDDDPFLRFNPNKKGQNVNQAINQPIGIRIAHGMGESFVSLSKFVGDLVMVRAPSLFGFRSRTNKR